MVWLAVDHLVNRRRKEHLDAAVDRILDHAIFLEACLFLCCEENCVCVYSLDDLVKLLFCTYVEGLLLRDDVGNVAFAELEETDDPIVAGILETCYKRY